ncbi:unnamed protein product [Caenorhabditis brenneri]
MSFRTHFLLLFCLLAMLSSQATSSNLTFNVDDDNVDRLAEELTEDILDAFDKRNFTKYDDYDVRFHFDTCDHKEHEMADFRKLIAAYRMTFVSGTVIKYSLIRAETAVPKYEGLFWTTHFEFLGQHHDVYVNFEWKETPTGRRWTWVDGWPVNCMTIVHKHRIHEWQMKTKVLT